MLYTTQLFIPSKWFDDNVSFVTGISVAGSGLGVVAFGPIIRELMLNYDWHTVLYVLSALMALCLPLSFTFIVPEESDKIWNFFKHSLKPRSRFSGSDNSRHQETISNDANQVVNIKLETVDLKNNIDKPSLKLEDGKTNNNTENDNKQEEKDVSNTNIQDCLEPNSLVESKTAKNENEQTNNIGTTQSKNVQPDTVVTSQEMSKKGTENAIVQKTTKPEKKFMTVLNELMDISILSDHVFLIYILANSLVGLAYFVPVNILGDRMTRHTIGSKGDSMLIITCFGIFNVFARVFFGWVGDFKSVSRMNLYGAAIFFYGFFFLLSNYTYSVLWLYVIYAFLGIFEGKF